MPTKMSRLLDMIGVAPDRRLVAHTVLDSDGHYGTNVDQASQVDPADDEFTQRRKRFAAVLFPPLTVDFGRTGAGETDIGLLS